MNKEQIYILYRLLSKDTASILISRVYTSIQKESDFKPDSPSGLLLETSLNINHNDKFRTLIFLQMLQDNLKLEQKELKRLSSKINKNLGGKLDYKYRKQFKIKLKDTNPKYRKV